MSAMNTLNIVLGFCNIGYLTCCSLAPDLGPLPLERQTATLNLLLFLQYQNHCYNRSMSEELSKNIARHLIIA